MKDLHPGWIFGFVLLFIVGFLAARVALGHVQQDTSYGLDILFGILATLAGNFSQWAFSTNHTLTKEKQNGTDASK
jgi:hypothetical protein